MGAPRLPPVSSARPRRGPRAVVTAALALLLAVATSAAAREERVVARLEYGNAPDQVSVRRAGEAPAAFLPAGVSSFARHGGTLYLPDGLKFSIRLLDADGLAMRELPLDPKVRAAGAILYGDLWVGSDEVILTDTERGVVHLLTPSLQLVRSVETATLDERFRAPCLVSRDRAGRLYLGDLATGRLHLFAGTDFSGHERLEGLADAFVHPEGLLIVARREPDGRVATVSLLDRRGRYLASPGRIEGEGPMGPVACVGVDRDGCLHFLWAERGARKHLALSPTGRVAERGTYPEGLAALKLARTGLVDPHGSLFLLSPEAARLLVRRFDRPR